MWLAVLYWAHWLYRLGYNRGRKSIIREEVRESIRRQIAEAAPPIRHTIIRRPPSLVRAGWPVRWTAEAQRNGNPLVRALARTLWR